MGILHSKMSGWGGFTANEMFEIVVEETDEGPRVSIGASNGKFLGVKASSGLIVADKAVVLEDELLKVLPRSTEGQAAVIEPAGRLRLGCRTLDERELLNRLQFRDRARNCQKALVRLQLQQEGIQRIHHLATHIWDCDRPRVLIELPSQLAAAGGEFVTVHRTNLLRNLFFCASMVAMGALGTLMGCLEEHGLLVAEAAVELPVSDKKEEQPEAIQDAVMKIVKFIKSQGGDLYKEPKTFLFRLIKTPMPSSLGATLKADVEGVKDTVNDAIKTAETVKPDIVLMVAAKRRLQLLQDVGAIAAMDLTAKCNELLTSLEDKITELRRKPDDVIEKFAKMYMRTHQDNPKDVRNRVCSAESFEMLADAMYRSSQEDEAYVALIGVVEEGQEPDAVQNAVLGDAASVIPNDADISVDLVSFDPLTLTVLMRFVKYGTAQGVAEEEEEEAEAGGEGEGGEEGDAAGGADGDAAGGADAEAEGEGDKAGGAKATSPRKDGKDAKEKKAKGLKSSKNIKSMKKIIPRY